MGNPLRIAFVFTLLIIASMAHSCRVEKLEARVLTLSISMEKTLKMSGRIVDELKILREETAPAVEFTGNLQRYRDMKAKEQDEH